jgi:ribonuclease T1
MTATRTTHHRRLLTAAALALAALILLVLADVHSAYARTGRDSLPEVALSELPREARELRVLIDKGGPFHYSRDGVVFGNRERILPAKPRGYYHEYTVRTPGAHDRGARRMVCGGPKTTPEVCYYTDDHYQTFRRIRS